jgi:3-hydroxybutyryl-CoA dehydrogenase
MAIMNLKTICCLGTGTMGSGIAVVFAMAGYDVHMFGRSEESIKKGFLSIESILKSYAEYGLISLDQISELTDRIKGATSLNEAAKGADFVIEAVSEDLDVKQNIFSVLDTLCQPQTIFATSTSGISPSLIAEAINRKDRFIAAHFLNPPHLMSLVEVIPGKFTSTNTIDITLQLLKELGKTPVLLEKDTPGFIVNRLQMALMREALSMIEQGVTSVESIDTTIKHLSRRYSATGLLEGADLGGLDVFYNIADYLMKDLCNSTNIPASLVEAKETGNLGAKTGQGFYNWTDTNKLKEIKKLRDDILFSWLKK